MSASGRLSRAAFTAIAVWLISQPVGVVTMIALSRSDLDGLAVLGAFGLPVLFGLAAGVWAYRRPVDAGSTRYDDSPE
jgi:hypothetical protein